MRLLRAVLAAALVAGSVLHGGSARAQSPSELAAGRELFVEALADEENGRFAAALEKYTRVKAIRDTVNVRYRIGASLEGLGKVARAVDAYTAAVQLGGDAEVERAAQARLEALRPRVAHLKLHLISAAFADAEVFVDGERVSAQELDDVSVDPGQHVVTASARGAKPFRAEITLSEGGRAGVPITLEPAVVEPPQLPPPRAPDRSRTYRTAGAVTGAAGGLFVIGGIVVLALRSSAISELNDSCPGGNCPASREAELTRTRDRALVTGPIGVATLAVGVVAVGTGVALFTIGGRRTKTAAHFMPTPARGGAMLTVVRSF